MQEFPTTHTRIIYLALSMSTHMYIICKSNLGYEKILKQGKEIRASQMVLEVKNPLADTEDIRDTGLILGQEDPLDLGNPLQYSCLENPMDRGAWWATVHRVITSQTQMKRLST